MFNHSLDLKIWDAKEKVAPRARFDRPKAFKMPQMRASEESEIEHMKKLISMPLKDVQTDIGIPSLISIYLHVHLFFTV